VEISTSRKQEGHQRDSREPCASLRNCGDIRIAQAAASGIGGVGCVTTTSCQSRLPDSVCRRHNCVSTPLPGGHQNPSGPYDARQGGLRADPVSAVGYSDQCHLTRRFSRFLGDGPARTECQVWKADAVVPA
jgi:hypothetical protein